MVGEITCAPTVDRSTTVAGFPSICTLVSVAILNRGARRVPRSSEGGATGDGFRLCFFFTGGGVEDRDSRLAPRRGGRPRQDARGVGAGGHHAKLGSREGRVGFNAIDEGRAAGRGGELPFQLHGVRPALHNLRERTKRVRVGKCQHLAVRRAAPLLQHGEHVGRGDHDGTRFE